MIALSAGHYEVARGAHDRDGFYEYPETQRWAREIFDILRGPDYDLSPLLIPAESLAAKVDFINTAYRRGLVELAVEIHFNSCPGGGAHGSETLYCPGSIASRRAARTVQGALGSILPPNRGVKEGWYKMDRPGIQDYPGDKEGDETPDYFLRATTCPALIIEPAFIQDRTIISDMREMTCEVLASALASALADL